MTLFPDLRRPHIAAAAFTLVSLTATVGLGLTALPAAAATRAADGDPDITIVAGGDRINSTSVRGEGGVTFGVSAATPCTTATANGRCTVTVSGTTSRTVTQESAPSGWFLNPTLGISPNSTTSAVNQVNYSSPASGLLAIAWLRSRREGRR